MQNLFLQGNASMLVPNEVYDLKGSFVDRKSSLSSSVMKDADFNKDIVVDDHLRAQFISQLSADVLFLNSLSIMDYSLLLGIHECSSACTHGALAIAPSTTSSASSSSSRSRSRASVPLSNVLPSFDPQTFYVVGIIDILQQFTLRKRMEYLYKTLVKCKDKKGISAINPDDYAMRFKTAILSRFVDAC
jgi:1-phosphatidylinositol-4-phosphate 5-kinase